MKSLTPFGWETVSEYLPEIIGRALQEDLGDGDSTSEATIPADLRYAGVFLVKATGVIAGLEAVRQTFAQVDERIRFTVHIADSSPVQPGDIVAEAEGRAVRCSRRSRWRSTSCSACRASPASPAGMSAR